MGNKPVTDLAGGDEVLGRSLENEGFDKAYRVLGQFLLLKKNKELFKIWITQVCGGNVQQSSDSYQCLSEWCAELLGMQMNPVLTFVTDSLM
jgi:hypothetical protein